MDLTTLGVWEADPVNGVSYYINAGTGEATVTEMRVADAVARGTFTYGNIQRPWERKLQRVDDPPTIAVNEGGGGGGGGGGATGTVASTSTVGDTAGTGYEPTTAVSAVISVTAGAAGKIKCDAPLIFLRTLTAAGETGAAGKWQWRVPGGTWADIGGEVIADTAAINESSGMGAGTYRYQGSFSGNMTQTKTGLTPGTLYELRFLWRRINQFGTASNLRAVYGVMSADGTVS